MVLHQQVYQHTSKRRDGKAAVGKDQAIIPGHLWQIFLFFWPPQTLLLCLLQPSYTSFPPPFHPSVTHSYICQSKTQPLRKPLPGACSSFLCQKLHKIEMNRNRNFFWLFHLFPIQESVFCPKWKVLGWLSSARLFQSWNIEIKPEALAYCSHPSLEQAY